MKQKRLINHGLQSLLLFTLLLLTPLGLWAQDDYPIQVAGVPVTSANAEAITGDGIQGTVTYNAAQNALTLDGATITGNILVTSEEGITIKVKGENVVNAGNSSAIRTNTEPNLSLLAFVKEGTGDCSLQLNSTGVTVISTYFADVTYTNLALVTDVEDVSYDYQFNGLSYYDAQTKQTLPVTSATITSYTAYDITVGGVAVTSLNASNITGDNIEAYQDGDYSVTYDVTTNTLSLDNARIASGGISSTGNAALNVALNNSVVLGGGTGVNGISCAGDLSISAVGTNYVYYPVTSTKDGGATLTLQNGSNADARLTLDYQGSESGFNAVVYDGLYLSADNLRTLKFSASRQRFEDSEGAWASTIKFSNAKTYELWLGGTKVTESNKDNILGDWGSATFDPDENLLTLNGMTLTGTDIYTDGIISRLPNLTISVKGDNTITCSDTCSVIRADMEGEQTLTIQKGSDGCSLTLDGSRVIRDFNTFTATGLSWNDSFTYKYDETLTNFNAGYRLMKADGEEASRNFAIGFKPALYDSSVTPYDLWVAGVQVTSANAEDIYGEYIDGTVSFDAANNVLTLERTTINLADVYNGIAVASGIADLTINLVGDNTVTPNVNTPFFAMYTGEIGTTAPTLTFNTDYYLDDGIYWLGTLKLNGVAEIGSLTSGYEFTLEESPEYVDPENAGNATTGWKVSINTENADNPYVKIWKLEAFDLWLDGNRVLSSDLGAGLSNGPKYNPVTERLVFSNNMATDAPVMSSMAELTVEINGACSITPESSSPAIYFQEKGEVTSGSLTFVRGDDAVTASLTLTANGENQSMEPYKAIEGYSASDIRFGADLNLTSPTTVTEALDATTVTIGGETYYNLKVGGVYVSQTNAADVLGDGTVTFTISGGQEAVPTYTLTLKGATLTQPLIVGLPNLTIDVQGTNTITTTTTCLQKMDNTDPALTFKSTSDVVGSLTLTNTDAENYDGVSDIGNVTISRELAPILRNYGNYTSYMYEFTNGGCDKAMFVPSYGVKVGDLYVYEGNTTDVLGDGKVSFDKANHTLTLTDAKVGGSNEGSISTWLPALTIELVGNNMLSSGSQSTLQSLYGEDVVMTVQSSGATKGCLVLKMGSSDGVFTGENVELNITSPLKVVSGNLNENDGNLNVVTIGEPVDYELLVEDIRVVAANASNITNDTNRKDRPYASFDAATNTLTLDNSDFNYYWLGSKVPVQSDIQNLKVKLVGDNEVTLGSKVFKYTGPVSETAPTLTFVPELVDDAYGSLQISGTTSLDAIANGYEVANTLLPAETNQGSTGWLYSVGDNYLKLWYQEAYGITVTKDDVSVIVNYANRTNVLNDENASVQFDGRSRLVLKGADLTSIVVSATNNLPETGLDVYLEDDNTITNTLGYAISSEGAAAMVKLAFHTGSDAPGSLTYTNSGAASENVFPGFEVSYFNKLAKIVDDNKTSVMIPLDLITDDVEDPAIINYGNDPEYSESVNLNNTTIEDVLYTLYDQQQQDVADDGLVTGTGGSLSLVINSTMTDLQVTASDAYVPGTQEYYDAFKGLTFYVPASMGAITLYDVITAQGYAFHVRIGNQEPIKVVNYSNEPRDIVVPYACSDITVVKIYLVNLNAGGQGAPSAVMANDGRRIGPKSTVSGGLGGLNVSSSSISVAPDAAASYLLMSAGDFGSVSGSRGIRVNNSDVTDLPVSAFASAFSVSPAPRRAPDDNVKTFIDASNTKITGKSFSRTEGAFKDVPEETLIYLPAGNTAVGNNFIIGGICDVMELKASRENAFEVASDFTVGQATFDREFTAGDAEDVKYYTFFLPYALNINEVDGELFEYVDYNSSTETVNMAKVVETSDNGGKTTPNKAYFFKPSKTGALKSVNSAQVKKFTGIPAAPGADVETEGLHGVYEYHIWNVKPDNIYCFSASDKDGIKAGQFAKVGQDTYIKPFRAYLRINASSAPEFLSINWGDGTTSIVPLDKDQVKQDAEGWYTITGFRLPSKPTEKGIYIHNNHKIVVK